MIVAMDEKLTNYVGRKVEVCYKENGFEGIWYKAIIEATPLTIHRSKHRGFCVRLLKDDYATPFTKLSNEVLVRPVPPVHVEARIDVEEGCVVDASRKDEWWTGLVIKLIEKDKCLVFFDSPPDIVQFERKDLRPHLYWVDEKYWVVRGPYLERLKRLSEGSMFSSGTMVEVSCKINKVEVVWVPAMIIKEFEEVDKENEEDDKENEKGDEETEEDDEENEESDEETEEDDEENDDECNDDGEENDEEIEEIGDDEKKYIVKFCDKSLSCKDSKVRPNKTVGLRSIRPTPPPFWVEEYQSMEYVEAFHGTRWRQGQVMGFLSEKRYMLLLKATNEEVVFNHSDLRPMKVWEDNVWKTKELPLTQALGNKMGGSATNGNTPSLIKESGPPVTPSPGVTALPLKQAEAETQEKTPKRTLLRMRNQNGLGNDSTRENESCENNNQKRKREQNISSVASVEENKVNDSTMDLPFEKKIQLWETLESMEVFKTQSLHFSPLVESRESTREMYAIGLMYSYADLIEEVKGLQVSSPISRLEFLNDSFAELEKHGFAVKEPQLRIQKLLSLKVRQAKKMEELKRAKWLREEEIAEAESKKVEIEQKILQLQRKNEEADKELEDEELEFLQMENLD